MKKKARPLKPLKLKEVAFVDKIVGNGGNKTKAVQEVYGIESEGYAYNKGTRLMQKPEIALAVEQKTLSLKEALVKSGITGEKIAEKVNVLLEAKKDGEPDYTAIDKGLAHATKIHGVLENEKPQGATTYNLIFSAPVQEKVKIIDAEIKSMLANTDDDKED